MVILSKLTKTPAGSDNIPYWLYRECATELSYVLSRLVNFSISEGVVPKAWKQAIITTVPKTALVYSVSDLRPISVTPILSRMVERLVVSDYLIPYIPRENLVDQYAYKATGSTTCATIGPIPWGHSGPLCHALSLSSSSSSSWTSMRRRCTTVPVAPPGEWA